MMERKDEYPDAADQLEQRCPEAREVMDHIPSAVIRWGMTVIALIVAALLAAACLVRWPETAECPCSLTPTERGDSCTVTVRLTPGVAAALAKEKSLEFSIISPLIDTSSACRATVTQSDISGFHDGTPEVTAAAGIPHGIRLPETGTSTLEARAIFIISERRLILHLFPLLQRLQ